MNLIYTNEQLTLIFGDISPFNIDSDFKKIEKNHISIKKVLQEMDAILELKHNLVILKKEHPFCLLKFRIANPQNNSGKSSGFRVIAITNLIENYAFILSVYSKVGSNRKDNLTLEEMNTASEMFKKIVKIVNEE